MFQKVRFQKTRKRLNYRLKGMNMFLKFSPILQTFFQCTNKIKSLRKTFNMNCLTALLCSCLLFHSWAFAENSVNEKEIQPSKAKPFSEMYVALEGGEMYPFFELQDVLDNALYGQAEFRYSYFENFDGYLQFGYSYLKTIDSKIRFPGVHQFNGRVGLLWHVPYARSVRLGAGFSCIWARSDGGKPNDVYGSMLYDNESEFGWHTRLNLPVFQLEKWNIGLNLYWEQLWTQPERSNMLWFGAYFERRVR